MPEYTITLKIKSGKRTPMQVRSAVWKDKDIFAPGMDKPFTTKNIGEYLAEHLKDRAFEKGAKVDKTPQKQVNN